MNNEVLQDALKMQEAMKLKFTYRFGNRLKGDKESVAAHTWSMFLIADYLEEKLHHLAPGKYDLDMKKVCKLIMYHDLIEAETGDEDLDPSNSENHNAKGEQEKHAMETFPTKLPKEIQSKFVSAYNEYEERKSLESKFVKIVDIIEAEFFCFNKGYLFKNWTKDYHESKRLHHYLDFPELLYIQEALIKNAHNNYYKK
ncbi:HD domain-containing protein [Candidatus Gracilibacteria bacterium]|nr:HD domain-containing protein [Candidatus Gracilibacteria bacterium]